MTEDLTQIRTLARELMSATDEPDPRVLIDQMIGALARAQRATLLRWAAGELLREANRWSRVTPPRAGASWKAAVGADGLLAQRYDVDGVWMELSNCTRDQVLTIAAGYRDRAARNAARAEEFERLADRMQRTGATTVGDLFERGERAA
jgi:hypothetical protein